MEIFEHEAFIPSSSGLAYRWHTHGDSVQRLLPPWIKISIRKKTKTLCEGGKFSLRIKHGLFKTTWKSRYTRVVPNQVFEDRQIEGPFSYWRHEHHFVPDKSSTEKSFLRDFIEYGKFKGFKKFIFSKSKIENYLYSLVLFRNAALCNELTQLKKYETRPKKKILISGGSGLVGKSLSSFLKTQGHDVYQLTRYKSKSPKRIFWNCKSKKLSLDAIEGFDVVIHLSGASVAKRWTKSYKKKITESRVQSTKFLVSSLKKLKKPPSLLITASGIGYYGNQTYSPCSEESRSGGDFLANLCYQWEKEASAYDLGRSAQIRLGAVLSPRGGLLQKIQGPISLGLGGAIGSGEQKLSWIALDDVLYHIQNVIYDNELKGPINFCAPEIVSNSEFTKTLGSILKKPTFFKMPKFAAKWAFGEMAEGLLLASNQATPTKLQKRGHEFAFPVLRQCLRHSYGKYGER